MLCGNDHEFLASVRLNEAQGGEVYFGEHRGGIE